MQDNGQQTFLQILCRAGLDADALCVSLRAARLDMQKKCLQIELEGSAKPQESCLRDFFACVLFVNLTVL